MQGIILCTKGHSDVSVFLWLHGKWYCTFNDRYKMVWSALPIKTCWKLWKPNPVTPTFIHHFSFSNCCWKTLKTVAAYNKYLLWHCPSKGDLVVSQRQFIYNSACVLFYLRPLHRATEGVSCFTENCFYRAEHWAYLFFAGGPQKPLPPLACGTSA